MLKEQMSFGKAAAGTEKEKLWQRKKNADLNPEACHSESEICHDLSP